MLPSLVIVFMLTTFTCGENPAIRVTLTNKGLQYGKHVGAGWVQDRLENMTIPVISGGISIGVLGTVHYTLKGVTVKQCDFPEPSVEFYKDEAGFKASISGLSIAVTAEWMMHCGLIHGGGSFKVAVFDVDATSIVELGEDADGHLSITSVSCNAGVGDVLIDFLGGASWIVKFLAKHLHGRIRGEIEKQICQAIQHATVDLEHRLQAMNVSFQVDQDLAVNVSLTSLPLVDASSLSLGLKGLFYSMKRRQSPPFEARPFTLPEQPGYMLSVGLSEFTANSASYGYYSVGLLQALINDSMIPPGCPLHLNTTSMGPFIPQVFNTDD
ncbi:bactericidal permeability-increasing protein-like [Diretmus argenteus]